MKTETFNGGEAKPDKTRATLVKVTGTLCSS